MRIEDPAPPDGSSPFEATVIRNIFGLVDKETEQRISSSHLLIFHPTEAPGKLEGYISLFHERRFLRTFQYPLKSEGDWVISGRPTERKSRFQQYHPGVEMVVGNRRYGVISDPDSGPYILHEQFPSMTNLWRLLEGGLVGTARWKYRPDFEDIRFEGEVPLLPGSLSYQDAYQAWCVNTF